MEPIIRGTFAYSYEKCSEDPNLIILESLTDNSFFSKVRINLKAKSITVFSPYQHYLFFYLTRHGILGEFIGSAFKVNFIIDVQKLCKVLLDTNTFPIRWHLVLQILGTEGRWAMTKKSDLLASQKLL